MEEHNINLNIDTEYDTPSAEEVYVNARSQEVYTKSDLMITPFDVIKATAIKLGQTVKEPASNCKHCQGRGYVGRESSSKAPIPCQCIYTSEAKKKAEGIYQKTYKLSRKERRVQDRKIKKMIKKQGLIL